MVTREETEQEMTSDELNQKLSNIESAYKLGLLKMSEVVRLIKDAYGAKHVQKHPHSIR
jgi:hypothetical protein